MRPPGGVLVSASHPTFLSKSFLFSTSFPSPSVFNLALKLKSPRRRRSFIILSCSSENTGRKTASYQYSAPTSAEVSDSHPEIEWSNVEVRSSLIPASLISFPKLSLSDQALSILTFIAFTTSIAFATLVTAAIPTLFAMRRAAISLAKLADTAREELPSTMAAIRLSGMEISDLTLELSDLSHEIADGVNKSAQVVQAAEAGVRQIGSLAHQQTMSMIQERASLPIISRQPMVVGAAKKTSRAVGQATKNLLSIISRGERSSGDEEIDPEDSIER